MKTRCQILFAPVFCICVSWLLLNAWAPAIHSQAGAFAAPTSTPQVSPISKPFCPKGSKGFFVLYYGTDAAEFGAIRKLQPDFVITAELSEEQLQQGYLEKFYHYTHDKSPGTPPVRTICYVATMRDGNRIDGAEVDKLVARALAVGYEGIFFDEIDPALHDYNYPRAQLVKKSGNNKIVIMNPGQVVTDRKIFEYADIVSVENEWFKVLPQWSGIAPYRWLSVQGDPGDMAGNDLYEPPKELDKAMNRLKEFRSGKHAAVQGGKGFWYYTSGVHHWELPVFGLDHFRNAITQLKGSNDACP